MGYNGYKTYEEAFKRAGEGNTFFEIDNNIKTVEHIDYYKDLDKGFGLSIRVTDKGGKTLILYLKNSNWFFFVLEEQQALLFPYVYNIYCLIDHQNKEVVKSLKG